MLLVLLFALALASTLYVSPFGDDSNPGTEEEPLLTISKAAQLSTDNGTIIVDDGAYTESGAFAVHENLTFIGNLHNPSAVDVNLASPINVKMQLFSMFGFTFVPADGTSPALVFAQVRQGTAATVLLQGVHISQSTNALQVSAAGCSGARSLVVANGALTGVGGDAPAGTSAGVLAQAAYYSVSSAGCLGAVTVSLTDTRVASFGTGVRALDPSQSAVYVGALNVALSGATVENCSYGVHFQTTARYSNRQYSLSASRTVLQRNLADGVRHYGGTLTAKFDDCDVRGNARYGVNSLDSGSTRAVIALTGSKLRVSHNDVGGVTLAGTGDGSRVALRQGSFTDNGNAQTVLGGALNATVASVAVTLQDTVFAGNTALDGGAVAVSAKSTLNVRLSSFNANVARARGGAIYCGDASMHVGHTDFNGNSGAGGDGSGFCAPSCQVFSDTNTFESNQPASSSCSGFSQKKK